MKLPMSSVTSDRPLFYDERASKGASGPLFPKSPREWREYWLLLPDTLDDWRETKCWVQGRSCPVSCRLVRDGVGTDKVRSVVFWERSGPGELSNRGKLRRNRLGYEGRGRARNDQPGGLRFIADRPRARPTCLDRAIPQVCWSAAGRASAPVRTVSSRGTTAPAPHCGGDTRRPTRPSSNSALHCPGPSDTSRPRAPNAARRTRSATGPQQARSTPSHVATRSAWSSRADRRHASFREFRHP